MGVVAHIYNPSTQEADAGGWRIWGQPGLHRETLSHRKNVTTIEINYQSQLYNSTGSFTVKHKSPKVMISSNKAELLCPASACLCQENGLLL
jgi:hypothetical protein